MLGKKAFPAKIPPSIRVRHESESIPKTPIADAALANEDDVSPTRRDKREPQPVSTENGPTYFM